MAKRITKETSSRLKLWHSTIERRMVTISADSPVDVIPTGQHREPALIRNYDSLVFISMGPKQVEVDLKGNAGTNDGVTIEGKICVQAVVNDQESHIKRIAVDAEAEEHLLKDAIIAAVQETTASQAWQSMMSVGEKLSQSAKLKLVDLLHGTDSCFSVRSLTIKEIRPLNKEFAALLEKAARAKAERKAKEEETAGDILVKKVQHEWELQSERGRLKLQQEKEILGIATKKEIIPLLKTDAGKMAIYPQETFKYKSKELEVEIADREEKERWLQMLFKGIQSRSLGQLDAIRAMLDRQFGIKFTDESATNESTEAEPSPLPLKQKKESDRESVSEEVETQQVKDQPTSTV